MSNETQNQEISCWEVVKLTEHDENSSKRIVEYVLAKNMAHVISSIEEDLLNKSTEVISISLVGPISKNVVL